MPGGRIASPKLTAGGAAVIARPAAARGAAAAAKPRARSCSTVASSRRDGGSGRSTPLTAPSLVAATAATEAAAPQECGDAAAPAVGDWRGAPLPAGARQAVRERLEANGFMSHDSDSGLFMHGRAYAGPAVAPRVTWKSEKAPRKDHGAPSWLTATEFEDVPEVLDAKVEQLAELLRLSKKTVLYTGAGISAAVIGQAALSGQNKVGWKPQTTSAQPTPTHRILGLLGQVGAVQSWVQQNHDGLPQKAGFPQECINEIHGSWYDPSNPVVKYCGSLHHLAFPWMEDDAKTADLVLVLGTSLGGLNADQVATSAADRSCLPGHRGSLGTVCINLQQTPEDGKMSLRIFGQSDKVLQLLLKKLGLALPKAGGGRWPKESRVLVPYDADGQRLPEGSTESRMWLDLNNNKKVRITPGHNIQGAKQPQYMHIGASKPVTHDGVTRQPGDGVGTVTKRDEGTCSFVLNIDGAQMRLGVWWLDAALRGKVPVLPIVNERPSYEGAGAQAAPARPPPRPRARSVAAAGGSK